MDARDLLGALRTNGALAVHALEERGVRVLRIELDQLGRMVVQSSSMSVRQAVEAFGPCVNVSRQADDLFPFKVTWKVTPTITVFTLVNATQARELGLMEVEDEEAPADAPAEAV